MQYIDGGGEEIDGPDSNDEVPSDQEEQDPDENHIPLAVNMNALHLADQVQEFSTEVSLPLFYYFQSKFCFV